MVSLVLRMSEEWRGIDMSGKNISGFGELYLRVSAVST